MFVVKLPIVGWVEIPRPEKIAYNVARIVQPLMILGALLTSVVIVIHGMFDARQVMQDSITILHLVFAAAAVVSTGLVFWGWVKAPTLAERLTTTEDPKNVPAPVNPSARFGALIGISAACFSIYFAVQCMVWLAHSNHAIAP